MTDIVERLEKNCPCSSDIGCADALCQEAADEIIRLRAENKSMDKIIMGLIDRLGAITSARILQGKDIAELSAKNERLRWMVRRLQERIRQLIQDNMLLAHDDTAEWGLEELMKDVGDTDE